MHAGRNFFTGGSILSLNSYCHLAPPSLYLADVLPVSGEGYAKTLLAWLALMEPQRGAFVAKYGAPSPYLPFHEGFRMVYIACPDLAGTARRSTRASACSTSRAPRPLPPMMAASSCAATTSLSSAKSSAAERRDEGGGTPGAAATQRCACFATRLESLGRAVRAVTVPL